MTLSPGSRLGPYEVTGTLGAGGMGEVYRARDKRLNRDVALKVLPDLFASDPERLARFQREAQVLASLNHPHIAQLYGLEDSNGVRALVMELVEGETLAERIPRGPIPIDETLPIARQIADALDVAHEAGVIHRDLKPASIGGQSRPHPELLRRAAAACAAFGDRSPVKASALARALSVALALALALTLVQAAKPAAALDAAMTDFWRASGDRSRQIDRVIATGASFDDVYSRLAAGRPYARDVQTGELAWQTIISGGARLPTTVIIPGDYDPKVKYPVRVYLHGGIARASIDSEARTPRRRLDVPPGCIVVYPSGFAEAPWWSVLQLDNIESTITRLKRTYNVDENRVHLMGVSDGGTGAFYVGMRRPTPWSIIFPFNASFRVLSNPDVRVEGDLYLTNLVNLPAYIINGGRDQLYPVVATEPYIALLKRAGAPVVFRPQMLAGHDTSWWPSERGAIDEFERTHQRDPFPDRISWQTDRTDRDNRFRWLVIDNLDDRRSSSALEEYNTLEFTDPPVKEEVFRHRRASGRVDLERAGNTVRVRTRGVGAFTLLVAPTEFDFEQPIQVVVNDREVFKGAVKKDVRALLRSAARDEDRTMLFGAELRIDVPAR